MLPQELLPATALLRKCTSTHRGCCQNTSPKQCLCDTNILTLRVLGFSRDKQDHWLQRNTVCCGTTCRGLGNDWQGQQTLVAAQSLTAGPTQQQPLMGLRTAKWGSTCQQLRSNGVALTCLAERALPWVT